MTKPLTPEQLLDMCQKRMDLTVVEHEVAKKEQVAFRSREWAAKRQWQKQKLLTSDLTDFCLHQDHYYCHGDLSDPSQRSTSIYRSNRLALSIASIKVSVSRKKGEPHLSYRFSLVVGRTCFFTRKYASKQIPDIAHITGEAKAFMQQWIEKEKTITPSSLLEADGLHAQTLYWRARDISNLIQRLHQAQRRLELQISVLKLEEEEEKKKAVSETVNQIRQNPKAWGYTIMREGDLWINLNSKEMSAGLWKTSIVPSFDDPDLEQKLEQCLDQLLKRIKTWKPGPKILPR